MRERVREKERQTDGQTVGKGEQSEVGHKTIKQNALKGEKNK